MNSHFVCCQTKPLICIVHWIIKRTWARTPDRFMSSISGHGVAMANMTRATRAVQYGVIKKTSYWNNVWKMWARCCCMHVFLVFVEKQCVIVVHSCYKSVYAACIHCMYRNACHEIWDQGASVSSFKILLFFQITPNHNSNHAVKLFLSTNLKL
jgi:hypothetical protein